MKVIISGAGIGGLTAALCSIHHGHEVTVLERAAELGEIGAGIQVSPNAMKVFEALGMGDALAANAFRPEGIEARICLLYTSPSPRDGLLSRMPSSA